MIEVILERVTNISMGTEIDKVIEFEETRATWHPEGRDTASIAAGLLRITERTRYAQFAANLTMLFNELDFLDRFEAAAKAGFRASSTCFPMTYPKEALAERLSKHGLAQVLHNLPAGDWARASAASPAIRSASTSSRTASAARSTTRRRSAAGRSTAWPASRRPGVDAIGCARPSSPTCASPRRGAGRGRHPAPDRADQHARHSRLLPQHARDRRSRSSTRSAPTISVRAVRHLPHAAHGGRARRDDSGEPRRASRTCSSPTTRAATSRAPARSTTPSCSASRRDRLRRLDRLRIQAEGRRPTTASAGAPRTAC